MPNIDDINEEITEIAPPGRRLGFDFKELWAFRYPIIFLIWRDLKAKYKQTILGFSWTILTPVFQAAVFSAVFGYFAKLPTDGVPAPIFYLSGLAVWSYFANSFNQTSVSLTGESRLLTKIYIPKILIPIKTCFAPLTDFAFAFVVLLGAMVAFGMKFDWTIVFAPFLLIIPFSAAFSSGLIFASANVKYRDTRYATPFLLQIGMYMTVLYPYSKLPESLGSWKLLYGLNPLAGCVETFRWALLRRNMDAAAAASPPLELVAIGSVVIAIWLVLGLLAFKKFEKIYSDVV